MGLSRTVSEINGDFSRKSQNFPTPPILRPRWRGCTWNTRIKKLEWWGYQVVKRVLKIGLFSRLDTITACGRLCRLSSGLKIMICLSNFHCTRSLLLALCALYIVIFLWYNRRQHKIQRQKKEKQFLVVLLSEKSGLQCAIEACHTYACTSTAQRGLEQYCDLDPGWPLFSGGVDLSI